MKKISIFLFSIALSSGVLAKNLSVQDFEKIGFSKSTQPFFQMIGATDGWKGKFKGANGEVYFYENKSKIPLTQLQNMEKQGSGKLCVIDNAAIFDYGGGAFCAEANAKLK